MKTSLTLSVLISAITMAVSSFASLLGQKSAFVRPDFAFVVFASSMALLILVFDYSACPRPPFGHGDATADPEPTPQRRRWRIRLKSRASRLRRRSHL